MRKAQQSIMTRCPCNALNLKKSRPDTSHVPLIVVPVAANSTALVAAKELPSQ